MTRPTLHVVGKGEPVVDDDAVKHADEVAEKIREAGRAGNGFWVLIDGEDAIATYAGDLLEMAATAEEVAKDMKRQALGFFE